MSHLLTSSPLAGQRAFVSGGAGALGQATAASLAAGGASVVLLGRDAERLAAAAAEVGQRAGGSAEIAWHEVDLDTDAVAEPTITAALALYGVPDVLIAAAGSTPRVDVSEVRPADCVAAMDAKYYPNVRLVLGVAPAMVRRGSGRVVVVSGVGGVQPMSVHLPGGAANAALELFSIGYARVLAPAGVSLNVVNPGATTSPRLEGHYAARVQGSGQTVQEARAELLAKLPLGREATVDEVAAVIVFMASPLSSFMVATSINVDGGQVIGP